VLLAAIRLPHACVTGAHEECVGAVAGYAGRADHKRIVNFAAQALDGITPQPFERTDHHRGRFPQGFSNRLARNSRAMELRPLGFGEIFDRAVTLYIRNFLPFAAIVAVLIVPLAILQYVLDASAQPQFDAMFRIFTHPERAGTEPIPTVFNSASAVALMIVMLLLTYAVWPFALNAVAVGIARLYRKRPVEFRACYEAVLGRWPQILGIIGVDFLVLLGWYVAVFAIIMVLALIVGAFATASPAAAVTFGIVLGVGGFLVLLPSVAPLLVALTFSMYAVVIEERPVIESLMLGFARVFNHQEFWRAVLFAIAVFAVTAGASLMLNFISIVAALAHLPLLETIIDSVSRAIITPFAVVLLAIYYFDVRIRREAFDLEASLERLAAPQPA